MGRDWTKRIKMNYLGGSMNSRISPACGDYGMGNSRL
jgi:hypothetical protein